MTISEDFIPDAAGDEVAAPTYPTAFGVTFTPAVIGVIIAVLGLAGTIYLILNLVLPTFQKYQELQASRTEKQAQVEQKKVLVQQIEQVRAELALTKKQQTEVLALFANEQSLDTLLLDLNRVVESGNTNPQASFARARLKRYVPANQSAEVIADSSLGAAVNGKLKRRLVSIGFEGTFEQTQAIIRNIERLQPLLLIRDYQSTLVQAAPNQQGRVGRGSGTINTSFQLQALIPANPAAAASVTATANPP